MDLHVFPIPIPSSTSLYTQFLWVFPVHQAQALVSCIQPGLVICFTLENIHVLMLLSISVYGHLGCFHVLAIVNSVAVNNGVQVYFQTVFFSSYMPRSGIAGSYESESESCSVLSNFL